MAAANALNVVRQIQALADGPKTAEMRECLGQVSTALLFFLDHPDSRVRQGAARTLAKLRLGYPEEVQKLDLSRAKTALARCKAAADDGTEDQDGREFRRSLLELLGEAEKPTDNGGGASPSSQPPSAAASAPASWGGASSSDRGEVILRIGAETNSKVKAAILEKTVKLGGVVSVTFEGDLIIVSTRTPAVAREASFLADLLAFVKEQGLQGASLVSAAAAAAGGAPLSAAGCGAAAANDAEPAYIDEDDDDAEPAYLDDDEEDVSPDRRGGGGPAFGQPGAMGAGGPGGMGQPQWSFFAQNNWMTGRRLQEFGDDPSIAARLAAAKKKQADRQLESQSRLTKLSAWWGGGR